MSAPTQKVHASSVKIRPDSSLQLPCNDEERELCTLGRETSGTTTTLTALGASLGALLVSPPGWYEYLPSLASPSHGIPPLEMVTDSSDVDLVGVRPRSGGQKVSLGKQHNHHAYAWFVSERWGVVDKTRTKVESGATQGGSHDTSEDLGSSELAHCQFKYAKMRPSFSRSLASYFHISRRGSIRTTISGFRFDSPLRACSPSPANRRALVEKARRAMKEAMVSWCRLKSAESFVVGACCLSCLCVGV